MMLGFSVVDDSSKTVIMSPAESTLTAGIEKVDPVDADIVELIRGGRRGAAVLLAAISR